MAPSGRAFSATRGNDRGRRLHELVGFAETGNLQPLPSDPRRDEVRVPPDFEGVRG